MAIERHWLTETPKQASERRAAEAASRPSRPLAIHAEPMWYVGLAIDGVVNGVTTEGRWTEELERVPVFASKDEAREAIPTLAPDRQYVLPFPCWEIARTDGSRVVVHGGDEDTNGAWMCLALNRGHSVPDEYPATREDVPYIYLETWRDGDNYACLIAGRQGLWLNTYSPDGVLISEEWGPEVRVPTCWPSLLERRLRPGDRPR